MGSADPYAAPQAESMWAGLPQAGPEDWQVEVGLGYWAWLRAVSNIDQWTWWWRWGALVGLTLSAPYFYLFYWWRYHQAGGRVLMWVAGGNVYVVAGRDARGAALANLSVSGGGDQPWLICDGQELLLRLPGQALSEEQVQELFDHGSTAGEVEEEVLMEMAGQDRWWDYWSIWKSGVKSFLPAIVGLALLLVVVAIGGEVLHEPRAAEHDLGLIKIMVFSVLFVVWVAVGSVSGLLVVRLLSRPWRLQVLLYGIRLQFANGPWSCLPWRMVSVKAGYGTDCLAYDDELRARWLYVHHRLYALGQREELCEVLTSHGVPWHDS